MVQYSLQNNFSIEHSFYIPCNTLFMKFKSLLKQLEKLKQPSKIFIVWICILTCEQLILLLFKKSMHVRWFEQRIAYLLWYKFRCWIPGCINTQSTIAVINQGKCVFTRFYMYVLLTYCAHSKGTWCWFWSNRICPVFIWTIFLTVSQNFSISRWVISDLQLSQFFDM